MKVCSHFYKATTKEAMEEERRLAYVSVTRAKDELYICEPECSGYNGRYFLLQYLNED